MNYEAVLLKTVKSDPYPLGKMTLFVVYSQPAWRAFIEEFQLTEQFSDIEVDWRESRVLVVSWFASHDELAGATLVLDKNTLKVHVDIEFGSLDVLDKDQTWVVMAAPAQAFAQEPKVIFEPENIGDKQVILKK